MTQIKRETSCDCYVNQVANNSGIFPLVQVMVRYVGPELKVSPDSLTSERKRGSDPQQRTGVEWVVKNSLNRYKIKLSLALKPSVLGSEG